MLLSPYPAPLMYLCPGGPADTPASWAGGDRQAGREQSASLPAARELRRQTPVCAPVQKTQPSRCVCRYLKASRHVRSTDPTRWLVREKKRSGLSTLRESMNSCNSRSSRKFSSSSRLPFSQPIPYRQPVNRGWKSRSRIEQRTHAPPRTLLAQTPTRHDCCPPPHTDSGSVPTAIWLCHSAV